MSRFEPACFPALDKQGFAGNPLDRSILSGQGGHSTPENIEQLDTTSYIVVCGSKVFGVKTENSLSLVWLPYSVLMKEGLLEGDATTHLLGSSKDGARFAVCVKITSADTTTSVLQALYPGIVATDLRGLLMIGSREDAAIAGHAVALTSWHTVRPPSLITPQS
jgi:NADH pyrophosphatase-like rudimentary NUDIX domain